MALGALASGGGIESGGDRMSSKRRARARWVWNRYVEKNRRDVEEKGEQLRTTSNLSALISGFVVVALVEFQFSEPAQVPRQSEALIERRTRRRRRAPSS